jgi:hypothetical protein
MSKAGRFLASSILAAVFLLTGALNVTADSGARRYEYLIGTGLLCALAPDACPAIAMAANGDTVELTGSGTLTIHPKSVTGGGTALHKDPAGRVLGTARWEAVELLSFNSYGSQADLPQNFEGGLALIRVHIRPDSAPNLVFQGILQVHCLVGKFPASAAYRLGHPPGGVEEGIRLAVSQAEGLNFNEEVSGFTIFIRQ